MAILLPKCVAPKIATVGLSGNSESNSPIARVIRRNLDVEFVTKTNVSPSLIISEPFERISFSPLLLMAYMGGIKELISSLACEGSEVVEPIKGEFYFTSEIAIHILSPKGTISFKDGAKSPVTK